jgi:hypothetical protein
MMPTWIVEIIPKITTEFALTTWGGWFDYMDLLIKKKHILVCDWWCDK